MLGRTPKLKAIEKKVSEYNDQMAFEKSIALLINVINNEDSTPYEKYYAYVLKSFTYKRLFNYSKTLHLLDLALAEGIKSDKKDEVVNNINAQKCLIYFDIQEYDKAAVFIDHLRKINFKDLTPVTKALVIMQDGYIKMLNNDFAKAEQYLIESINLIKESSPPDLPNFYGKKLELYNRMKLFDKRDQTLKEGLKIAKQYKNIKYEMYLHEIMRKIYHENQDYKNAFYAQKTFDSLVKLYNANDSNSKLDLAEKKIEDKIRSLEEEKKKYLNYILLGIISSLFIILVFAIKLYQTNKAKRILVEKENIRIHHQIEQLTKALDEKGNATLNLANYHLTDRQKEIIQLVRDGLTNKEIAIKLFISENTVKYHLKVIYEILDIEHRSAIK